MSTSDSSLPDSGPPPPHNRPQQPPPDSPAAVGGAFDAKGVHGGFITNATIKYWEDVLGGEKWIKMVQDYLNLERMPPTGRVRGPSCFFWPL